MSVSKRLRFEVLRRDNFTCRYCGANPEDRELRVDHVVPVALGGKDEPTNLVTACDPCNTGKSSSAPDSELVADVEEKALVWGRAIALAAQRREEELADQSQFVAWFEDEWLFRHDFAAPLPDDWAITLVKVRSLGLPVRDIDDSLNIAYAAPVKTENVWRYFCGVCWRKLDALRDTARGFIDLGEV